MELGEISVSMKNGSRGRLRFGEETCNKWGLYKYKSVDVSHAKSNHGLMLFQFRKDTKGGYRIFSRKDEKGGLSLHLKSPLKKAGAITSRYHAKSTGGVITVDFGRDMTSYRKEQKRRHAV